MPRATSSTPPGTILIHDHQEGVFGPGMITVVQRPHSYVREAVEAIHFQHGNTFDGWGIMTARFSVLEDPDAS